MRLMLLRHAKSDWHAPSHDDFDRPLNKRGQSAATRMGQFLRENRLQPSLIRCSSAQRTRETLALMLPFFEFDTRIEIDQKLYHADLNHYQAMVAGTAPHDASMMIIGHNPTIGAYACQLAAEGEGQEMENLAEKFPTCALAVLDAAVSDWQDFKAARLTLFQTPRGLHGKNTDLRP